MYSLSSRLSKMQAVPITPTSPVLKAESPSSPKNVASQSGNVNVVLRSRIAPITPTSPVFKAESISSPKNVASQSGNVNVVLRSRPLNKKESEFSSEVCLEFEDTKNMSIKSTTENNTFKFAFDRVFDPNTNQHEIFDFVAKDIVDSVLEGFNGTIFAYGQTSSGKTFTMQGVLNDPQLEGIIPRLTRYLYERMCAIEDGNIEFVVKASIFEIYNEKIRDLLEMSKNNLQIREDKNKGIFIEDLTEYHVVSSEKLLGLIKKGFDNRAINSTNMNDQSSRSHSLVVLNITQNNLKDLSAKSGKLYLVDLAGSEKISKTGATGSVLDEAKMINKSLTTLGHVIKALTEGKNGHIPYRDSKLTRVLQESLGGNSKTCLIITCSPSIYNEPETLSTLRFGLRAKKIKNKAKVNKEFSIQELKVEVNKLESQLGQFKSRVDILEEYLVKNGLPLPGEELEIIEIPQAEDNPQNEFQKKLEEDNNVEINIDVNNSKIKNKVNRSNLNYTLNENHIIEINNKYIEVLDIVNDLETEKAELQDQLKKASQRINDIHINQDKKDSFAAEINKMKVISELRTTELEKEIIKMKRYMEKNRQNLSMISENNIDLDISPHSVKEIKRRMSRFTTLTELQPVKKAFDCLEIESNQEICLEIVSTTEKNRYNYSKNDKDENLLLLSTNPFSIGNHLDINTNSGELINSNSKHNNTPDYIEKEICISNGSGGSYKNAEVIDELLEKLREYSDKVPEINKLIDNFKEKINHNNNMLINNRELENKVMSLGSRSDGSVGNSFPPDSIKRQRRVSEIEKINVMSALENKVEKLFDNLLKEKEVVKTTVKNQTFCNWNLKCWKEKYRNLEVSKK